MKSNKKDIDVCFVFSILEPPSRIGGNLEATPTAKTPRTPNAFALFVKDNYAAVKSSRTDLPHSAVMKLLGAKFAESKMKLF